MVSCTVKECASTLLSKNKIVILIHANPDGDCIGSGAALASALVSLGKDVRLVCPSILPKRLAFMCEALSERILCFGKDAEGFEEDLIVSVDIASYELLGSFREKYDGKIELCIDHHMINTVKCEKIHRRADAAACGEIILEILDELSALSGKAVITKEICDMLYGAISSDSGSFKYGNTTAKTLLYASRLKSLGADSEKISKLLFDTRSLSQFKLTGLLIPKTELLCGGKLAYCLLLENELALCGASKEDCDAITQMFREIEGVEISIFAKQSTDGGENSIKMSLRSNSDINVAKICEAFGGGGHVKAAGCTVKGKTNEEARELIISKALELYPELN